MDYAPLHQLIRAIGLPATHALVRRFGGTRIYLPLPEHISADHAIARVVGVEAARALARLWPQERPHVPRPPAWFYAERDSQIHDDFKTLSMPQMVEKWSMTERRLYQILAKEPAPSPVRSGTSTAQQGQGRLF